MATDTVLPLRPIQPTQILARRPGEQDSAVLDRVIDYLRDQRSAIDRFYALLVLAISDHHSYGVLAERPTPGVPNRTYLVTDAAPKLLSIDDGSAWHDLILP